MKNWANRFHIWGGAHIGRCNTALRSVAYISTKTSAWSCKFFSEPFPCLFSGPSTSVVRRVPPAPSAPQASITTKQRAVPRTRAFITKHDPACTRMLPLFLVTYRIAISAQCYAGGRSSSPLDAINMRRKPAPICVSAKSGWSSPRWGLEFKLAILQIFFAHVRYKHVAWAVSDRD
jgi:hypothetical protein